MRKTQIKLLYYFQDMILSIYFVLKSPKNEYFPGLFLNCDVSYRLFSISNNNFRFELKIPILLSGTIHWNYFSSSKISHKLISFLKRFIKHGAVTVQFFEIGQRCDFVLTKNTALKKASATKKLDEPFWYEKVVEGGKI